MGVVGPVGGFEDAQGPLEELRDDGVLAEVLAGGAQVGQGDGHLGVIEAVGGLDHPRPVSVLARTGFATSAAAVPGEPHVSDRSLVALTTADARSSFSRRSNQ